MAEPFIGEIRMFAGNFAPNGWAFCEGQLQAIAQNTALFSLLGTTYGGDGQTTFALPDLRGRVPMHMGQGPGLSNRVLGELSGTETVTLTSNQLPAHTHTLQASSSGAETSAPSGGVLAMPENAVYTGQTPNTALNSAALTNVGGSQPHDNFMPYLCVNFIISLYGIFPSQS